MVGLKDNNSMPSFQFKVDPIPKPRMTQSDKWKKRPCVMRYWAYKAELLVLAKQAGFIMPECNYHLTFFLQMPDTWSKKKKAEMMNTAHRVTPDKDNLEKGFLDALCIEDKMIWDGRVTKKWGMNGSINIVW